jgi:hypothetical protein
MTTQVLDLLAPDSESERLSRKVFVGCSVSTDRGCFAELRAYEHPTIRPPPLPSQSLSSSAAVVARNESPEELPSAGQKAPGDA